MQHAAAFSGINRSIASAKLQYHKLKYKMLIPETWGEHFFDVH